MKYKLLTADDNQDITKNVYQSLKALLPLMSMEKTRLIFAFIAVLVNSGLTILAPILVGQAVDKYIVTGQYHGVVVYSAILLTIFVMVLISGYIQTRIMGGVGQRILFGLRGSLFDHIQQLPIAFFNENKAGDLISRINNDTDKLNQFFSRSLVQFIGNIFVIIGAGVAMLLVNLQLGVATLLPAVALLIFTRFTSSWIKHKNTKSLQTLGGLSAEVQESLENFRVIVAFNRRDYFRERFTKVNNANYGAAILADIANNTYVPVFGLVSNLGSLIVITYGLSLIASGSMTFGILISYLAYVNRFYEPLRQMASIWSDLQTALAAWERITEILHMHSDLPVIAAEPVGDSSSLLEFKDVSFEYTSGKSILKNISFDLEKGKTYALVGPTGGGKSTTAALMARLYDPSKGMILFDGVDIRAMQPEDRASKIGFILQDPFLFSGSVRDNIVYGNPQYVELSHKKLEDILSDEGLSGLLARFDNGLETQIDSSASSISLGQKQLIAFIRAALRHPDLLILDEATANIDTVTEQLLDSVLRKLPASTTLVIIAHRLNTIENADQILFVNGGTIQQAGSLDHAVAMLEETARKS
jgi:ATP-binding cassette subfamily B protein